MIPRSLNWQACCYWLTGLPAAGKTTLAMAVQQALSLHSISASVLDGDLLRQGLSSDLGYAPADRSENIRRLAEIAKLMVEAGIVTLVSAISPYAADRQAARNRFAADAFFEVFVDTDLDICMSRDPKGLYRRARSGEITNLTGFNAPYERPLEPDLIVSQMPVKAAMKMIVQHYALGPLDPTTHNKSLGARCKQ